MRGKKKIKKTGQHGFFQWQTLLVASAFLGFFVFAGYICGNIATPYRIPDTNSDAYHQSETAFLIFFIVGSIVSLLLALFSAYMCDHPTLLKDKFLKLFRKSAKTENGSAITDENGAYGAVAADVSDADGKTEIDLVPDGSETNISESECTAASASVSEEKSVKFTDSDGSSSKTSGSENSSDGERK